MTMTTVPNTMMLVRNKHGNPTVFCDEVSGMKQKWGPAGDPLGDDLQQIPTAMLSNIDFVRALNRGVFEIVNADADTAALLEMQARSWQDRQAAAAAAVQASFDPNANNDLIQVACLVGGCADLVLVKEKQKDAKPPLCDRHQGLASQFVPTVTGSTPQGTEIIHWDSVTHDSPTTRSTPGEPT